MPSINYFYLVKFEWLCINDEEISKLKMYLFLPFSLSVATWNLTKTCCCRCRLGFAAFLAAWWSNLATIVVFVDRWCRWSRIDWIGGSPSPNPCQSRSRSPHTCVRYLWASGAGSPPPGDRLISIMSFVSFRFISFGFRGRTHNFVCSVTRTIPYRTIMISLRFSAWLDTGRHRSHLMISGPRHYFHCSLIKIASHV